MTTRELLMTAWDRDPVVLACTLGAFVAYLAAFRGRITRRAGVSAAAIVVAFVALASPIGVLSRGYLFSAHMLQHLLLVLVVPLLFLLGVPAIPSRDRPSGRARRWLFSWSAGIGAMWLWHAPALCDAASSSDAIHRLQTLSLLAMGTAFWWPIVGPRASSRMMPFPAMVYLFTACVACTILGILVTFSPIEVCSIYAHPVDRLGALPLLREGWGVTPKTDQEIGGLIMWVPACVVYAASILGVLARYYGQEGATGGDTPVTSIVASARPSVLAKDRA